MKFFISLLFFLILLSFFHFRGIVYYDEGYILNSALRIVHGQIPYLDFDSAYTPLSFVLTAVFLKIFGVSLFTERLAALAISLFSIFALSKILSFVTKSKIIIFLSLLFFIGWGPSHINFTWPVMFALCFLFYSLWFFLEGMINEKNIFFYWSGIMAISVFLAKQNFGIGLFVTILSLLLFQKIIDKKIKIIYFLYGCCSLGLITLSILLTTHSLFSFIDNFYVYTIQRIIIFKTLDTPFLYDGSLITKGAKLLFYTLPLTLSCVAGYLAIHYNKKLLILPGACITFYLLGIRPTTDYNHFVPLLATSCIPLVMIVTLIKSNYLKKSFLLLFTALLVLGFQTAYFKEYYKWDAPLSSQNIFVKQPPFTIFLNAQRKEESIALIDYINKQTQPTDVIFVNYYAPMVYFLTNRANATRYDLVSPNDTLDSTQRNMIMDLENKRVKLVVMSYLNEKDNSRISNYVRRNYPLRKRIGGFVIFSKKSNVSTE